MDIPPYWETLISGSHGHSSIKRGTYLREPWTFFHLRDSSILRGTDLSEPWTFLHTETLISGSYIHSSRGAMDIPPYWEAMISGSHGYSSILRSTDCREACLFFHTERHWSLGIMNIPPLWQNMGQRVNLLQPLFKMTPYLNGADVSTWKWYFYPRGYVCLGLQPFLLSDTHVSRVLSKVTHFLHLNLTMLSPSIMSTIETMGWPTIGLIALWNQWEVREGVNVQTPSFLCAHITSRSQWGNCTCLWKRFLIRSYCFWCTDWKPICSLYLPLYTRILASRPDALGWSLFIEGGDKYLGK